MIFTLGRIGLASLVNGVKSIVDLHGRRFDSSPTHVRGPKTVDCIFISVFPSPRNVGRLKRVGKDMGMPFRELRNLLTTVR